MNAKPETNLPPALIEQVLSLPRESQDELIALVLDGRLAGDGAPGDRVDWAAEIARRSDEIASGNYNALTRQEAEAQVRDAIRQLGVQL